MRDRNCKLQIANCKLQIGTRERGVVARRFRSAAACVFALVMHAGASAAEFTFDDISFWVGTGTNRAAMVIDWVEDSPDPPALAWGYRWDGSATGRDMLLAIAAADERLFAKLGNTSANPVRLYGLGYDTDDDGEFGACRDIGGEIECTEFDDDGLAYSGEIFVAATATDADDLYREGWATGTGFWHYGIPATPGTNPYDGGQWIDFQFGMTGRTLADGDWDSWAFQLSTTPPFTAYAENPQAAPAPYPPGDFNRSGTVDANDYQFWHDHFGSTTTPAADGNSDGVVDAADYTVWRDNLPASSNSAPLDVSQIPEPCTVWLALCSLCALWLRLFSQRKEKFS